MTTPDPTRAAMQMALEALQTCRIRAVSEWEVREVTPKIITEAIAALRASLALPAEGAEPRTADLRAPAVLPDSLSRDEILRYYSEYADMVATEVIGYQRQIRELKDALAATPHPPQGRGEGDEGVPVLDDDQRNVHTALRRLIADDAYAMTFQTMGQYRTNLLRAIDAAAAAAGVATPRGGQQ